MPSSASIRACVLNPTDALVPANSCFDSLLASRAAFPAFSRWMCACFLDLGERGGASGERRGQRVWSKLRRLSQSGARV